MSTTQACDDLFAMRKGFLDQSLKIRDYFGESPKDPFWQDALQRADEAAKRIDNLMIKAGCPRP